MAPGRMPSVREGSSFHRLGDSQSGIEYSRWLSLPQGPYTDSYFLRDLGGGGGGVFGVPRYLITCGDDACGPSPSPSWDVKLLWAEPAGAYEFNADPRP
ncbi:hypothetical protein YC2023_041563 [Brassica napus]